MTGLEIANSYVSHGRVWLGLALDYACTTAASLAIHWTDTRGLANSYFWKEVSVRSIKSEIKATGGSVVIREVCCGVVTQDKMRPKLVEETMRRRSRMFPKTFQEHAVTDGGMVLSRQCVGRGL